MECQNKKNVCFNCVGNDFLKEYIKRNNEYNRCDYCKAINHGAISIPVDQLAKEITRRMKTKYTKRNIYSINENSDYHLTIIETRDIIANEIKPTCTLLADDLYILIGAGYWVDKYDNTDSPDEQDEIKWEMYSEKIRCSLNETEKKKILHETLTPICQYIFKTGLLETVDIGGRFYRARPNEPNEKLVTHIQLGPPPKDKVKYPNRFTKAGESAFYGSTDDVTPIIEVYDKAPYGITVGVFETTIPLTVINFYRVAKECKQERSLFEDDLYIKMFLDYFVIKLAAPANEKDATSYIPTQEAIRFFTKAIQEKQGSSINGIIYPSSKTVRRTANCILFFDDTDCTDDEKNEQKPLKLLLKETISYPPGYWTEAMNKKYHITFAFMGEQD